MKNLGKGPLWRLGLIIIIAGLIIWGTIGLVQSVIAPHMSRSREGMTGMNNGETKSEVSVPDVSFPFKNIRDEYGNKLNVLAVSAPFREPAHEDQYTAYRDQGLVFCGLSSYLEFPKKIDNPYEDRFHEQQKHDYPSMVSSWIHCFRDPGAALRSSGLPLLLLTEADLKNPDEYRPNPAIPKTYDFIYICLDDNDQCTPGWNWYNRNFDLAKRCFVVMCGKYGLRGLIVGRTNCELPMECAGKVTLKPFLPFHEFQAEMQKCRFLFAPNVSDASPRVITEAILYDMPVLVNYNIVGGWHNVVSGVTGETFTSEHDIGGGLDRLVGNEASYHPRQWYIENRGMHSRKVLAEFLKKHYPELNRPEMVYANI